MKNLDFNDFSDTYREELQSAIAFSGQSVDFFAEAKALRLLEATKKFLGDPAQLKALDMGCGIGLVDRFLVPEFAELSGIDIAAEVIAKASGNNPRARYQTYDGHGLPFPDESFDLVFTACVLHCMEPEDWRSFLAEMARVVKRGGLLFIFEHNPLNPLTRLVVKRCVLASGANLLTARRSRKLLKGLGLHVLESKYFLFFPWRGAWFAQISKFLGAVPLGAQYYVTARK